MIYPSKKAKRRAEYLQREAKREARRKAIYKIQKMEMKSEWSDRHNFNYRRES